MKETNPLGEIFYNYTYYRPKEKRYSYMTGSGMTYDYDIGGLDALYHSDHLGSASWITNRAGDAIQHLQYLPYGAPFVDQRTTGYHERFRFTGKERDEETGYGYFGARYMDHELMTMWLSVDPMADKYPSISPYVYCAWNPVKLVDPDGKEAGGPPKSRITVRNGCVVLNMNNLHNTTRNRINDFNNDPRNWPSGCIGAAIGILARVEYITPELLDPQGGYGYSRPSSYNVKTEAVKAESTGGPDRRVKPRATASGGSKGMNLALVAIDAAIYTLNAVACYLWNNDMKHVDRQLRMLESAFSRVQMYDKEVGLPEKYCTPEQMLYIANYVMQRENVTKDPMVKQIGDEIRAKINYMYNNQVEQCPRE